MGYENLKNVLAYRSGDKWTVNFTGEQPIIYDVPRILSDDTIHKIKERLQFNRRNNRTDVQNKYVLTGFIRCENCGRTLTGQTIKGVNTLWQYYNHTRKKYDWCKAFTQISAPKIEQAVIEAIFDNIVDVPSFKRAISESLPDDNKINQLKQTIERDEKQLKQTEKELDKLVDIAMQGTLNKETIRNKEAELLEQKNKLQEELQEHRQELNNMPDTDQIKDHAEEIRRSLLEKYGSKERIQEMTFDEKRELLHWLFDGKDKHGTPYGICVNK
ncbi:MAG: recombinase zinc beta ribbon domain-containing protein [Bacteroidales bacterium]